MLRSLRNEVDMMFAESGPEALEIMKSQGADVIISDMRMPRMDGAELLMLIKENYPNTMRIMLTGQADSESVLRTVGVVHQFLGKPCDPDHLKSVINRSLDLQSVLSDPGLKNVISQIGVLPAMPSVYSELQSVMITPEVSIAEVAEIIERDMSISVKVLHLINSAFFGLFSKVDSIQRAVKLLGLDVISSIVLGLELFSNVKLPPKTVSIDELWSHSMSVGSMAKRLAENEGLEKQSIDSAYLSGILHDLGKLVLATCASDQFKEVTRLVDEEDTTFAQAEEKVFNTTHSHVGAYLLGLWGFNTAIMESVCFHHCSRPKTPEKFTAAQAVYIADILYYTLGESGNSHKELELNGLKENYPEEKLDSWQEICAELIENS